jgi:hypothetical protein
MFGECGEVLEVFADLQAWGGGGDGFEFAADFCGSEGFEVEGIELAWSAPHEEQEAAACASEAWFEGDCGGCSDGLGGGGGSEQCEGAGCEEGAAGEV